MNFNELYKKIHAISEGEMPAAPTDASMEECGMPMVSMGGMPSGAEQDHVSMNVSLNGSGTGGVRDLMNILRDIEQAGTDEPHQHDQEEPLIGDMVHAMGHEQDMGEEYENSVHDHEGSHTYGVDAVIRKGNDMHSKSHGALKHNGGENPMHEALVDRLSQLYQSIKEQEVTELAKWRDPKHKDKLYTQEPDDGEGDHHDYYHDSRPDNDPGEKHSTFDRDKRTDKLHYPYGDYQVGQKAQVGDRAKKGLLTKNSMRVVKNRIKSVSGDHPRPNLPK